MANSTFVFHTGHSFCARRSHLLDAAHATVRLATRTGFQKHQTIERGEFFTGFQCMRGTVGSEENLSFFQATRPQALLQTFGV